MMTIVALEPVEPAMPFPLTNEEVLERNNRILNHHCEEQRRTIKRMRQDTNTIAWCAILAASIGGFLVSFIIGAGPVLSILVLSGPILGVCGLWAALSINNRQQW